MTESLKRQPATPRPGDQQLRIEGISAFYGEAQALKDVSLSANSREIVAILGSNGAGKSTLLRVLTGLLKLRDGRIIFRGDDISGKEPDVIIKKGIASVPEGRELFGPMTVRDNLLLGAYTVGKQKRKELYEGRMEMIFDLFPVLRQRLSQRAETLSGGEQQMLALGRALMADPAVLALDEPSLGLAPLLVAALMETLQRLCRELALSILLVEQNAKAAIGIADYVYVLERGEVTVEGASCDIANDTSIQCAYLGS